MHYGDKEGGSEIENINKINEDVANKNSSEIDGYYADKAGKHCRNCNSIFESENKLHQYLRNCKTSDTI
jgi:hypothetical protein